MATVKDFVRKTPSEAPGPAHHCDTPGISAEQFLYAVYRDRSLPLATRMDAAAKLLRIYPEESFKPQLKIIMNRSGFVGGHLV
jgi:hypothetical protein